MGYKLFNAGEILEANDLNQHIVQQVVARFVTVAERSAAIPIPERGQMTYVNSEGLQIFEGDGWHNITIEPL